PSLLDGVREDEASGAALAGEHHGEEPHRAPADDQHRCPTRHGKQLEARETAGGRLRHRRGDGIESPGQRMDAARREENALGKATDPGAPWALAHAPGVALGALAAAVRRLARHHAPDEMTARAAAGAPHDPGVLVTEDQGRLPRKEPLGGVMSVPQMPAAWTSTTTCPAPGTGSGASSIVNRASPLQVATFMRAAMSCRPDFPWCRAPARAAGPSRGPSATR